MQKLLTIVVPVYKVEPYINKCLDSCLIYKTNEQGREVLDEELMNQLEVIIVNDGTPDNSAEMSREYVKRYPQTFRQIDKENGGHGSAWNVGLKEATGKYLRFLDSDDWLTNLDKLITKLLETDVDLAFTDECVHHIDEGWEEPQKCSFVYDRFLSIDNVQISNILTDFSSLNFRKCTYRTVLLQSQYPLFREHISYDDTILFVAPYLYAKTLIAFDFVVYNLLRGRDEQSMNPFVLHTKAEQYVQVYLDLCSFVNNNSFLSNVQDYLYFVECSIYGFCFSIVTNLGYKRRKKLVNILVKNQPVLKLYNKRIRRYMKLPYVIAYSYDGLRNLRKMFLGNNK